MRSGDRDRVGRLRLLLSELQKAAKEGSDDELAVLRRERKRRVDAAEQFRAAGRDDLATGEEAEAELIAAYLPAELSDAELRTLVEQAVADSGATSPKDMGAVMKAVMPSSLPDAISSQSDQATLIVVSAGPSSSVTFWATPSSMTTPSLP